MSRGASKQLLRGDTVGVVATAFAVRPGLLRSGVRRLRRMGYRVLLGDHLLERDGYLAGSDDARARDLRAMLLNPEVKAIWFARGGYGTTRLLDSVPWRALRGRPKLLVGYSDLTALFCAIMRRSDHRCLHGPVVCELGRAGAYDAGSLRRALSGQESVVRLRKRQILAGGQARGRLLGGNLTVLAHMMGTRHAPDFRGAVLFLEEVGEEAYRIDRALTHLEQAGAFGNLSAVLLGNFSVPRTRRDFPPDRTLEALIAERFLTLGIPVISGLRAGHVPGKITLPLGGTARVDGAGAELRFAP